MDGSGTDDDDVLLVFHRLKKEGQDAEKKVRGWRVVHRKVDEAKLASRHRKGDTTAWAPDGKRCRTEATLKSHMSFLASTQRDGARDSNEGEREDALEDASAPLRKDECAASAFDEEAAFNEEEHAASSLHHQSIPSRTAAVASSLSDEEYVLFLRNKYKIDDGEADQLMDRMRRAHSHPGSRVGREDSESGEQRGERVMILHATHSEDAAQPSPGESECLDAEKHVEAGHPLLLPPPPPLTLSDGEPHVRSLVGEDALRAMRAYALEKEMKEVHRRVLMHSGNHPSLQALLLEESSLPVGILVQTTGRRGKILLVHVKERGRGRGLGSLLGSHAISLLPPGGSLSVDSPACTAKAAVRLWLSLGFMGDEELLSCHLAEESAYVGCRSVRLSFTFTKDETEDGLKARCAYLRRVALAHPEMASACARGMRVRR